MGNLRDQMETDMKLRDFRPATQSQYLHCVRQLTKHYERSPDELGEDEVRSFLLYLREDRALGPASVSTYTAALKFFYGITLRREEMVLSMGAPKVRSQLPVILSGTEVAALLGAIRSREQRTLATVLYASGLRISEACALEVSDIDSQRMLIHVRDGKGGRDRFALLSPQLLGVLRRYWRAERPEPPCLFPAPRSAKTLRPSTVRKSLLRAALRCGITKRVTPHVLRHCFGAHMLELGTDIRVLQALLGHRSIRMTQLYVQVSTQLIARTQSPLDVLGTPEGKVLG